MLILVLGYRQETQLKRYKEACVDFGFVLNKKTILVLPVFPKNLGGELLGLRQAKANSTLGRNYEIFPKLIFLGKWPFSWEGKNPLLTTLIFFFFSSLLFYPFQH